MGCLAGVLSTPALSRRDDLLELLGLGWGWCWRLGTVEYEGLQKNQTQRNSQSRLPVEEGFGSLGLGNRNWEIGGSGIIAEVWGTRRIEGDNLEDIADGVITEFD